MKESLPVATELAFVEDLAHQVEVLVFFVSGLGSGRGSRRGGVVLCDGHIGGRFSC